EQAGYAAVAMGCLDEPGVQAAKEALDIPVVGETEASIHMASMVGRRFSFLMPGETAGNQRGAYGSRCIEDLVRMYGFADKLASVRSVTGKTLEFAARAESLPEAMLEQANLAMSEDGADVVIGYGSLSVIGQLQEQLPIPVIDPIQASAMMAESLARLRIAQSKRAYPMPGILIKEQE
ncbi:MAG: aspartate/glutamate racemase family protein, partial [Acidobacteriota bacterium]|nr:aspartate/glutamate racemase family protein [Acidobacteriota bacterium]